VGCHQKFFKHLLLLQSAKFVNENISSRYAVQTCGMKTQDQFNMQVTDKFPRLKYVVIFNS